MADRKDSVREELVPKVNIIITDNVGERIEGNWDGVRYALIQESKPIDDISGMKKVILLNPVEAIDFATFIMATVKANF